jgi:hypothetical protein
MDYREDGIEHADEWMMLIRPEEEQDSKSSEMELEVQS